MEIPWDRNNNKIDELKEKKNDKDKDSHVILSKSISESKDESNSRDKEKETICKETTLNSVCTDKHSPAKSNMNHKSKQSVDKADRKVSKQMRDLNENISKEMENDIPLVRIVGATPSPRPPDQSNDLEKGKSKRYRRKLIKEDVIDEDDELDEDDDDECEEEEEDVEEEEEETEMTTDEKKVTIVIMFIFTKSFTEFMLIMYNFPLYCLYFCLCLSLFCLVALFCFFVRLSIHHALIKRI